MSYNTDLQLNNTNLQSVLTAINSLPESGDSAKEEQEKSVDITENGITEVIPDEGKVLSKVSVNVDVPIPDGYIKPSGTFNIIENGTHDVTEYASVDVNVSTVGSDNGEEIAGLLGNTLKVLDNSIVTSIRTRACQGATALVTVNLPSVTSLGSYAFYQASGLKTAKLPKLTSVSTQCFYSCAKLEYIDCGMLGNLTAQTFNACTALTTVILRKSTSICTLSNVNAINNTSIGKGIGYIYVPRVLLSDDDETKDYRRATNWTTYANQFRALEDYTVDGTTTGELDESKI